MKHESIRLLTGLALVWAASAGQAAITCTNPASAGFLTAISALVAPNDSAVPNITQGTVTFSCTRNLPGDALNVRLYANNGANFAGAQNRARRGGANFISYELYQDSVCGAPWTTVAGAASCAGATCINVPLLNVLVAQPLTVNFWGCVPLGQVSAGAGNHNDTVSIRIRDSADMAWLTGPRNMNVRINSPGTCNVTTQPTGITIAYTAFVATAQTGSTTIATTCTNRLPYTLQLNAYGGVSNGVHYDLDINGTAPAAVSAVGNGLAQSYTINVSAPAGQAGACVAASCTGNPQTHSVTITY